ncbi:unnamed protein product [Moneuplotes crassus]|uniref:B box-type domain-containing protein n=1 Tax=Euplotes crassus TaxID=5936 RepID=A0AAD1XEK2_EUPCR|nr:unnamed protein product [Moneuplotes crassus]
MNKRLIRKQKIEEAMKKYKKKRPKMNGERVRNISTLFDRHYTRLDEPISPSSNSREQNFSFGSNEVDLNGRKLTHPKTLNKKLFKKPTLSVSPDSLLDISFQKMGQDELSDGDEIQGSEILTCNICCSNKSEEFMICRFCGNNACNSCWDSVTKKKSKCFYCLQKITHQDLIRNLMVEQIRQKEKIIDSRYKNQLVKKCFVHKRAGKLFCENCCCFICTECVTDPIHSGHKICDINDRPDIKEMIQESNQFVEELQKGCNQLEQSIKSHSELVDISIKGLTIYISNLKNTILKKIEEDTRFLKEKVDLEIYINNEAKKELGQFQKIVNNVTKLSSNTINPQILREELDRHLGGNEAPNIKNLTANSKLDFSKVSIEEKFNLGCDSTKQTKFSEFIKKTLKDGINQMF